MLVTKSISVYKRIRSVGKSQGKWLLIRSGRLWRCCAMAPNVFGVNPLTGRFLIFRRFKSVKSVNSAETAIAKSVVAILG